MNPDAFSPTPEGCKAFQQQISEAADAGTPLTPEIQAHLQSCEDCLGFAKIWFPKPPAALAESIAVANDDRLRGRILEAASRPEIIPFPGAAERRANWMAWSGRVAACLALMALAWWLLDPKPSRVRTPHAVAAEPTLAQSLARMEDHTKHERQIIQTAFVDGGRHVSRDLEWTLSALE